MSYPNPNQYGPYDLPDVMPQWQGFQQDQYTAQDQYAVQNQYTTQHQYTQHDQYQNQHQYSQQHQSGSEQQQQPGANQSLFFNEYAQLEQGADGNTYATPSIDNGFSWDNNKSAWQFSIARDSPIPNPHTGTSPPTDSIGDLGAISTPFTGGDTSTNPTTGTSPFVPDGDLGEAPAIANLATNTSRLLDSVGSLGAMRGHTGEMNAGHDSHYQGRRKLTILNDDHMSLYNNNTDFVRRVYVEITTVPSGNSSHEANMVKFLNKKLEGLGEDADQYLLDISSMCISAVFKLHHSGDHLFDAQFRSLKPRKEDKTMTATQRVDAMCDIFRHRKKIVADLVDGGVDAITKLVAAPNGAAYLKGRYKDNNDARKENLKQLKELKAPKSSAGQPAPNEEGDNNTGSHANDENDVEPPPKRRGPGRPPTKGKKPKHSGKTNQIVDNLDPQLASTGSMTTSSAATDLQTSRKRKSSIDPQLASTSDPTKTVSAGTGTQPARKRRRVG